MKIIKVKAINLLNLSNRRKSKSKKANNKGKMADNLQALMEKMAKENVELKEKMGQEIVGLKKQNAKLNEEYRALKRKMEKIETYFPKTKKVLIYRKELPVELLNEMFASMSLKNAFRLLAKMPNSLLARNVRKMTKSVKEEMKKMKKNKLNAADCGPKLRISEGGLVVKNTSPNGWNSVRAELAIPKFNLNPHKSIAYFEVEIVTKQNSYDLSIGFCTSQFQLEGKWLGGVQNSNRICDKEAMWIDGKETNFQNEGGNFQAKDVIGIGIAYFPTNSTIKCFATCNGNLLEMAKLPIKFAELELYPAITIYCLENITIHANFGASLFAFNSLEIAHNL